MVRNHADPESQPEPDRDGTGYEDKGANSGDVERRDFAGRD
jgi:hypothetical protein